MIRVLYASATDRFGGAEASLLTLLKALDRDAVRPVLACPDDSLAGPSSTPEDGRAERLPLLAREAGIDVVGIPYERLKRTWNPLRLLGSWQLCKQNRARTAELVRSLGIDLIHANSPSAFLQVGGERAICHLRDLGLPHLAARAIADRGTAVIATSRAVAAQAREQVTPHVRRIPNGVDTDLFSPGCGRDASGHRYLLMVGNLVPWKEHRLFIECLAQIRTRSPDVRGMIAGSDLFGEHLSHAAELKVLAEDLGLKYALTWMDHVPVKEMPSVIAGATVLVHPAEREPFGRAVLEAMACATPVVAIDAAGPRELLASGGGELVPAGDLAAMCRAVQMYLDSPARVREHGSLGRCEVLDHYTAELHARAIEKLYWELCGR